MTCEIHSGADCAARGGVYQGGGTYCAPPDICLTSGMGDGRLGPRRLQLATVPNPGAGGLTIQCVLPVSTVATLEVYDASGRMVRRLHGGTLPAGETAVSWDGRDEVGRELPAGVYLGRIRTVDGVAATRIVMTR